MTLTPHTVAASERRALAIEGLTVSYLRRGVALNVLSDISLRVEPGEAYGLVGESGCGKTTVAMAVMRYLAPNARVDAGRILFQGTDLLAASDSQLQELRGNRMAMVYQDPGSALNPAMTVGRQSRRGFPMSPRHEQDRVAGGRGGDAGPGADPRSDPAAAPLPA